LEGGGGEGVGTDRSHPVLSRPLCPLGPPIDIVRRWKIILCKRRANLVADGKTTLSAVVSGYSNCGTALTLPFRLASGFLDCGLSGLGRLWPRSRDRLLPGRRGLGSRGLGHSFDRRLCSNFGLDRRFGGALAGSFPFGAGFRVGAAWAGVGLDLGRAAGVVGLAAVEAGFAVRTATGLDSGFG